MSAAGRTVHLWKCDGAGGTRVGYHGQIVGAQAGDRLYLRSGLNAVTVPVYITKAGTYNTAATVGDNGGPWRACADIVNVGERSPPTAGSRAEAQLGI